MKNLKDLVRDQTNRKKMTAEDISLVASNKAYSAARDQLTEILATEVNPRPVLNQNLVNILANVLGHLWKRIESKECHWCPFPDSPTFNLVNPLDLVALVNLRFSESLTTEGPLTLKALNLVNLKSSTVRSISEGRSMTTPDQLEEIRREIYKLCPVDFFEPDTFLSELLEGIENLHFHYPTDRLQTWAERYSPDSVFRLPYIGIEEYFLKLMAAWRSEWLNGKAAVQHPAETLGDFIASRTRLRRLSRGLEHVCSAVFSETSPYNDRIQHTGSNAPLFRKRMNSYGEFGLSAEMLFGICVYTGINPLSMLIWLADSEIGHHGQARYHLKTSPRNLVEWTGSLDPHEYQRFLELCGLLSLVPDQHKFILGLMSAGYVYRNLPTTEEVTKALPVSYAQVANDYCAPFLPSMEEFNSLTVPYKDLSMITQVPLLASEESRGVLAGIFCLGLGSRDISGKLADQVAEMDSDQVIELAESEMGLGMDLSYSPSAIPTRLVTTIYAGLDDYLNQD